MKQINRQAIVGCPATLLYTLVNNVAAYPDWFEWCTSAKIISATEQSVTAELGVKLAGVGLKFVTCNSLNPPKSIELKLESGPFRALHGAWHFEALGQTGCRVSLQLNIDLAGSMINSALAAAVSVWADRMVDDFIQVAKRHV